MGAWGLTSRLLLPRAANKSGSEAIHCTGLHDILNSGFGEACDEDRPASQCGCAARRSKSMTWSSTSCSGTSVSSWYAVVAYALVCLLFLFRAFARVLVSRFFGVPAVALFCLFFLLFVWLRAPRSSGFLHRDFLLLRSFLRGLVFGTLLRVFCSTFSFFFGRRVHPDGPIELALWRSFSNSSSSTLSL